MCVECKKTLDQYLTNTNIDLHYEAIRCWKNNEIILAVMKNYSGKDLPFRIIFVANTRGGYSLFSPDHRFENEELALKKYNEIVSLNPSTAHEINKSIKKTSSKD